MRTLNRFAPGFKRIMVAVLAVAMLVSSISFSKGTNAKAAASTIGSAEDYSVTATDQTVFAESHLHQQIRQLM